MALTDNPRRSASARTSALEANPPSGNIARASRSGPMTASTYDWSFSVFGDRCSSRVTVPSAASRVTTLA